MINSFTELEYRTLLKLAGSHWRFIGYSDYPIKEPAVLWRHDIDFSAHRARSLAEIEASEGIRSTYFILLHGAYYNPLETEVAGIIKRIRDMGHALGLHFDPSFYGDMIGSEVNLLEMLDFEKNILERSFDTVIEAFSWHNPTIGGVLSITNNRMAGMTNAYGADIQAKYSYISDSNGIWQHRRLMDVLETPVDTYLQVLTHPEWWVPEPMFPRDRIVRAVNGRAESSLRNYDELLEAHSRPNVRAPVSRSSKKKG